MCSPICGACCSEIGRAQHGSADRSEGSGHRRLQGRRGDRGPGEGGRDGRGRHQPHHGRVRQGVDGDSVLARRRRQGGQGQGRRQGERRLDDPRAGDRRRRGCAEARAGIAAGRRRSAAGRAFRGVLFRQGGYRMRHAGAGRRSRRLLGRLPRRRSRHEDRAGRALRYARRRVSQCRLYPEQGAAAYGVRGRRGQAPSRSWHFLWRAADRPRQAARRSRTA